MIKKTDVYVLFSGRTTRITFFLFCRNTKRYRKRFKSAQSSCWGSAVRFPQVFCQKKGKTFNTMTCFYIVCFAWQSPVWTLSEPNENATKGATSPLNWTKSQVRIEVRKLVWLAAGLDLYTTQVHLTSLAPSCTTLSGHHSAPAAFHWNEFKPSFPTGMAPVLKRDRRLSPGGVVWSSTPANSQGTTAQIKHTVCFGQQSVAGHLHVHIIRI